MSSDRFPKLAVARWAPPFVLHYLSFCTRYGATARIEG
jgi:hypothetical protein